jgi:outer membrane protein assembly factor BamB
MEIMKNKTVTIIISVLFMLSMLFSMTLMPNANAHTPPWNYAVNAYISVAPATTGINQAVLVDFFVDWLPPGDTLLGGGKWTGLTVTVTLPDKTQATLGPFITDATGGWYTTYTPTELGNYSFVLNFPGQYASNINPVNGMAGSGGVNIGDYYENATSNPAYLTVQQAPVAGPPFTPLPTQYWTRPINGQNTYWSQIASNWLGGPYTGTMVQDSGSAPNSAHIMWTLPLDTGGVVGGTAPLDTAVNGTGFYSGLAYNARDANPIIMNGYLYVAIPLQDAATGGGMECINLNTGAIVWTNPSMPLIQYGYYYDLEYANQYGVVPQGLLFTANFAQAYSPTTGQWLFNVTGVPTNINNYAQAGPLGTNEVQGPNGVIYIYVLNIAAGWMAEWNSSNLQTYAEYATQTYNSQGVPNTAVTSISQTVNASAPMFWDWNVSIPKIIQTVNYTTVTTPSINGTQCMWSIFNDEMIGGNVVLSNQGYGTPDPFTLWAISTKPGNAGQLLWFNNYTAPPGNQSLRFDAVDPVNQVMIFHNKETLNWVAYNITTGAYAWTTNLPLTASAFEYYDETVNKPAELVYNGCFYSGSYGGTVYCFDDANGKTKWTFGNGVGDNSTASSYLVYGAVPTFVVGAADGKIYTACGEHSPDSPLWESGYSYCIDASTGQFIFKTSDWTGYPGRIGDAIADGYLEYYNAYDAQIYVIGKGPTQMTAQAPNLGVPLGSSLVIRGTIVDISAGTKENEQAMDFPNGVPCVSEPSMTDWMNYVYGQQAFPSNATGVPIVLTVADPNGNTYTIGNCTSDLRGSYNLQYTPQVPGLYTLTASFAGSNGYWPSSAETSFVVNQASTTPSTSTAPLITNYATTSDLLIYMIGTIVVVIIIGAILAILMLRKRP